jgi:two-component system CheB/CheR fusion protein
MAFVVIAHLNPDASSSLAHILSRHTKMLVTVASDAMSIQRNHVYVIPPNVDLFTKNYTFRVVSPRTTRNKQIDVFFTSLADAMGANAVGIIVSGYDGDGTEGCKHIKAKGGATFAQGPSAEVNEMPNHAGKSGHIDFVLSFDKIADKLREMRGAGRRVRPA